MAELGRRDPRFVVGLVVHLGVFDPDRSCHTVDISRTGLRLSGAPSLSAGEMVWMHIRLPDDAVVEVTGVVRGGSGTGTGVEFSMFMRNSQQVWEDYLRTLEWGATGGKRGKERRQWPRDETTRYEVRAGAHRWTTGDSSLGGLFLPSETLLEKGTVLDLQLQHPDTGLVFPLRAEVVRHQHSGPERKAGMGLRFLGLDALGLEALQRFMDWGEGPRLEDEEP